MKEVDMKAGSDGKEPREAPYVYDQIVIGGGPAGLTAAVYSARKRLDLLLLAHEIGGQMLWTSEIENYMGYQYITGYELMEKFKTQAAQFPITIVTDDRAAALKADKDNVVVETETGKKFTARTLIIATGKRPRPLGVPGEEKLRGRGVSYCSICDGPFFRGMEVVVAGGGNSALTAVLDLAPVAKKVTCVNHSDTLSADPVLIEKAREFENVEILMSHEVTEVIGESVVEGVMLRNKASDELFRRDAGGVFVEIGLMPNTDFADGFVKLNSIGEIIVDCGCHTSLENVFAAGDATTVPEKQIIVSAGEGAKASLSAHSHLLRKRNS